LHVPEHNATMHTHRFKLEKMVQDVPGSQRRQFAGTSVKRSQTESEALRASDIDLSDIPGLLRNHTRDVVDGYRGLDIRVLESEVRSDVHQRHGDTEP